MIISDEIILELLRRIKSRLGLSDWTLKVVWVTKKNDESGCFKATYGQDNGVIEIDTAIGNDFKQYRETLFHELMHVRISRVTIAVECLGNSGVLGAPAWAVFEALFQEQLERDVEALSLAFAGAPGEWADDDLRRKHEDAQKPKTEGGNP